MSFDRAFWKNKRVLVTGHTGFKGGWLSNWLSLMGSTVCGYALAPSGDPNLYQQARVSERIQSIIADITDGHKINVAVTQFQPDIVFHLAAQSLVRESYLDPITTYSTNVMGTLYLLEALKSCNTIKSVVIVTSDKCYDNKEWLWPYREDDPLGGFDPYSSSKACTEILTSSFRQSFLQDNAKFGLASARAGNVVGGGDWSKDRLVPDLIRAFYNRKSAHIRNPHAIRPWQHVLEPLRGYLLLAQRLYVDKQYAQAWNFGPPNKDVKSVAYIADYLTSQWHEEVNWSTDKSEHPHEATLLNVDSTKANQLLAWYPYFTIDQTLQWTTAWYKASIVKQDMRDFTHRQIEEYIDMVSI